MLQFVLLLQAITSALILRDSECACNGKCSNPILDWKTDCPAYGYDCQRTHAALGLFRKHVHDDYVTIRCADDKASLFVNGKSQEKLKCRKKSGDWMVSNECKSVESALCALPCTTCSTKVPNFLTVDATSISVLSANGERPCSIGFCNGDGLSLLGIDAGNVPTVVYGNVTCTGSGWMDVAGRIYPHAVCQYYSCSTLPIAAPSADTVSLVSSGSRSFSCPTGSFLTYANAHSRQFRTQYPLTCGPNDTWQLYGLYWDAKNFASVTCTPYQPCATSISPVSDCVNNDLCTPPTQTTIKYGTASVSLLTCPGPDYGLFATMSETTGIRTGNQLICTGQKIISVLNGQEATNVSCMKSPTCPSSLTNIGPIICKTNPEQCAPATATSSSITCPSGSTLVFLRGDVYDAAVGNLTCVGGSYYDAGSRQVSALASVPGATCTTQANLACRPVPNVFAPDGISLEFTPDNDSREAIDPALSVHDDQWYMILNKSTAGGLIFYNNNFSTGTHRLQCGDDNMWHTPTSNNIVTSATYFSTDCTGTLPPNPAGSQPVTPYATIVSCKRQIVYQLPGESTQNTIVTTLSIICAPNGQFALPVNDDDVDYFIPPPGTLIGCLDD